MRYRSGNADNCTCRTPIAPTCSKQRFEAQRGGGRVKSPTPTCWSRRIVATGRKADGEISMKSSRIASSAVLLAALSGWASPSFSQAPSATGLPGISVPGVQTPSIPGMPQAPNIPKIPGMPQVPGVTQGASGVQSPTGTAATTAGAAASMVKGQDPQWTGKRCLNRGDNSLGTCQDVCRNIGVTRATDAREYAGICNF